jgi:hypothetical protein
MPDHDSLHVSAAATRRALERRLGRTDCVTAWPRGRKESERNGLLAHWLTSEGNVKPYNHIYVVYKKKLQVHKKFMFAKSHSKWNKS